jgi:DNA-binding CsgD family transcriptional regulator
MNDDGLSSHCQLNGAGMGILLLNSKTESFDWEDEPGRELICDQSWGKMRALVAMTSREYEVCRLIFEGNTREEAGKELGITTRTVRHYMELLHEKLNVSNRVGLVLRLVQLRDFVNQNTPEDE